MTTPQYSLDEINLRLHTRIRELCIHLFGKIDVRGNDIWMLNPQDKDANWTSFSFNMTSKVWKDFAAPECAGKGALSLIATFATRGEFKNTYASDRTLVRAGAVQWAKDWLGLTDRAPDPAEAASLKARAEKDDLERRERAARVRGAAFKMWLDAKPLDGADPASRYLAARGIDVTKLGEGIPRALRFHPEVWAANKIGPFPAMIGCISKEGVANGFMAVHRTYLKIDRGTWSKQTWPDCKTGKQVKGAFAGGSIRLTRGESGKKLADAPDGEWIQVSEGIEDGLTGAIAKPEIRSLAAVSISNIGGLELPKQLGGVYMLKQNDSNALTIKQFDDAMDQLAARGFEPAIVPIDPRFKDANDMLLGKEMRT